MLSILLLVIGALFLLGGVALLVLSIHKFDKDELKTSFDKKAWFYHGAYILSIAVGALFLQLALNFSHPEWASSSEFNYALNASLMYFGIFFFALFMAVLWSSFALRYYKLRKEEKFKKVIDYLLFGSIPLAFVFFMLWMQGLGPYLTYPLVSGFVIDGEGFHWITSATLRNYNGFHIAFYGIIILFGVAVCYWISDHKFYKKYGKHGILDTLVIVAFLAGVLGARIWYVVGNWEREGFNTDPGSIFRIWDGGLTIIGGAAAGIVVGIIFLRLTKKYVDMRWAIDTVVPTILLAQAIGRWGNFFNCEVYGGQINTPLFMPNWIAYQLNCNNGGGYLDAGTMHMPLFLIEGILNVASYFIIVYGTKPIKKFLSKGDLAGMYFIFYGVIRIALEGLRDSSFNMGTDNSFSIWGSLNYIIIGAATILCFHLYDLKKKNPATKIDFFAGMGLSLVALLTPLSAGLVVNDTNGNLISEYSGFAYIFGSKDNNIAIGMLVGFIFLVLGIISFVVARFAKKEDVSKKIYYASIGLLVVSGVFFLLGKNIVGGSSEYNYSLGPGFILPGMMSICLAIIALLPVFIERAKRKETKKEEVTPNEAS